MKIKKNNFRWLTLAVFLHLFSLVCSVYGDTAHKWPSGHKEINYWLVFCSWWCTQASLITIIYFVYKLLKKSPPNYFDKVFDLIVINANLIAIGIFTISAVAGLTPVGRSDKPISIFSWKVSFWKFWWFYAIIWHYLAPVLTITYFVRRKISLAQTYFGRRQLFLYSFFHPFLYFIFVLLRPSLPGANEYHFAGKQYPYFFFDWIMGNDFRHIVWGLIVVLVTFFWLVIFWLSTLFFWWYANHKLKAKRKGNLTKKNNIVLSSLD